ncbi:MAG: phosphatase PAP2 family protein [Hyphomicrobiales bacterium]
MTANPRASGIARSSIVAWLVRLVRAPRPLANRAQHRTFLYLTATAAFVVVMLALAAMLPDALAATHARQLPARLVNFFNWITDFGKSGWLLYPLSVFILMIAAASAFVPSRVALWLGAIAVRFMFIFTAIALPGLFTNLVKGLIGRARPFVPGIADPYVFNSLVWRPEYASLPSGHSTTALSVVVALGALWPRARFILWGYAALICISRIVITAHFPSDVVAGAVVGGVGALMVRNFYAARGLGFSVGLDGKVRPLPWPNWRYIKRAAAR